MERPTDELVQRLLAAVAAGGGADVEKVIDQARAEAAAEVKDLVKSAMKAVLLRRAVIHLEAHEATQTGQAATDAAAPAPAEQPSPPAPEPIVEEAPTAQAPAACYVYAITRAAWGAPPADVPAIDRRSRLRTVGSGDLQAILSDVSLDQFGPAVLEERLKDLQWVEEKVRAHDAAVKALSAVGTVIPCRFCTILSGEDEARAALQRHHDAILKTLESLDGKTEWGVKLLADTRASAAAPASAPAPAEAEAPAAPDAGRSYLLQKKRTAGRRDERRDDVMRSAAEAAEACHRELFALSADAAILPTRDRGGSNRGWHLALNAAYLVADDGAAAFHARVAELAAQYRPQGLRIDLTGPWPPYNFAALNLSQSPSEAPGE